MKWRSKHNGSDPTTAQIQKSDPPPSPSQARPKTTPRSQGLLSRHLLGICMQVIASTAGSSWYLAVYLIQRSQDILYKGPLKGALCWGFLAELAGVGVEVDIAPQATGKLPGVHGPIDAIDCAIQLGK